MGSNQKNEVLRFIDAFTLKGRRDQVTECFTTGCCYWFAHILLYRFMDRNPMPILMYDQIANHFGTQIGGRIYDITGDVTDTLNWIPWSQMNKEPNVRARIERDTIRIVSDMMEEED